MHIYVCSDARTYNAMFQWHLIWEGQFNSSLFRSSFARVTIEIWVEPPSIIGSVIICMSNACSCRCGYLHVTVCAYGFCVFEPSVTSRRCCFWCRWPTASWCRYHDIAVVLVTPSIITLPNPRRRHDPTNPVGWPLFDFGPVLLVGLSICLSGLKSLSNAVFSWAVRRSQSPRAVHPHV